MRCAAGLCLLFVGYFASAGSMIGLAFHPRVDSLAFSKQLRATTFSLYTPVILISKTRYCPKAVREHLSWSIGEQRKRVFTHTMAVSKRGVQTSRTQQTSHPRTSTPHLDRVGPSYGFWDWERDQLLSFGASLFMDAENIAISKMDPAERRRQMLRHSGFEIGEAGRTPQVVAQDPLEDNEEHANSQLSSDVCHSSRLGGSLALPEESNWLPMSVLLTPEELAEMTPEDHDEESRRCFPVRHFSTCADRSEPFVFTSYITITR
jgi:hypothetical protein